MATIDVSATDAARRIALQMLQERGRVCGSHAEYDKIDAPIV